MRQADGSDLLGANDARNASIGIIYVAPSDDRPSVLEAILMQDKLGRKQVAVVLPENSRAFQRPVDFDGLKNMRRGLKSEIIFVASGGPGPAEFARQRRFPVYTSLDSYKAALQAESPSNGNGKKGPSLFNRKPKLVPNVDAPAPLESFDEPASPPLPPPPQPLVAPMMPVSALPSIAAVPFDDDDDITWDEPAPVEPFVASSGANAMDASVASDEEWSQSLPPPQQDAGPSVAPVVPLPDDEDAEPIRPRSKSGPIPIPIPLQQTGASTKPLNPDARGTNGAASPPARSGNTGKQAAIGAGVVGAGAAAAFAVSRAPVAGGGQPPIRGNVGGSGSGGGGGRSRRRSTRQLLAILLVILTLLLLAGIAFASPMGQGLLGHLTNSTVTATVTITPAHQKVSDSFVVAAVTGTPDTTAQQVQARIVSYTSPSGSGSANATGSLAGANATGTLIFVYSGTASGVNVTGGTLTGASRVPISFGSFFLPFGSKQIQGIAVNQGIGGNIPARDIDGQCCGNSNIHVQNGPFSGGQDPVPNSVITQNDINSASNNLISSLKPSAQNALQQKIQANEQVVSGSLKCTSNVTPNHRVGDQAKSVTVAGTVTCTEEAYDQKGALDIATTALKAEAAKNPGAGYALVGNVVTSITSATVVDAKNTVSLVILAQGQWVYHFTDTILNGIKNKLAKESQSAAQADLKKTTGVLSATISLSSGTTMPDAANITIKVLPIAGLTGSPSPGSGSPTTTPSGMTPTSTPAITPTTGLGSGSSVTPTATLGGS
jgi:hypothetical protein